MQKALQWFRMKLPVINATVSNIIDCTNTSADLIVDGIEANDQIIWFNDQMDGIGITEVITVTQGGMYTVLVTNENGCEAMTNVAVDVNLDELPDPQFAFQNTEFDFQFEDMTTGNVTERLWDFGDGNISTEQNPIHTYTDPGYYDVCLTTTNDCGSNVKCDVVLAKAPMQISGVVTSTTCYGSNDGAINITLFGGLPGFEYVWTGEGGFTSDATALSDLAPGTYDLMITDLAGEVVNAQYIVTEPSELVVLGDVVNTTNGEDNGAISLDITGGNGDYTIEWSNGMTEAMIEGLPAGTYEVVVTDALGCRTTDIYTVESSVNVNEISSLNSFSVFPNPANDMVNINLEFDDSKTFQFSIISLIGEVLYQKTLTGSQFNHTLNTTDYNSGVYLIQIQSEDKLALKKLIISK